MPTPSKRRFTNEQKQDAIQDYKYPRRSKSTAEANYDRFLERKKSSEVYYDPYTGEVTKQNIPLVEVYPEFDLLLAGKAAVDAFAKHGIVLRKERYGKGKLSMDPKTDASVRNAGNVLKVKLVTDKTKDKVEEEGEKIVFSKSKKDIIKDEIENMVDNLSIKNYNDLYNAKNKFKEYLNSKDVNDKLSRIDSELKTDYVRKSDLLFDNNKSVFNLVNDIDGSKVFGRTNFYRDNKKVPADINRSYIRIKEGVPYNTIGHEGRHMLDNIVSTGRYDDKFGNVNNRLISLIKGKDGKNLVIKQKDIVDYYKNIGFSDKDINYITDMNEISSFLGEYIDREFLKTGKIPTFTRESFEDMIYNNPIKNNYLSYTYKSFIRDKNTFIDNINKYAFSISPLLMNKENNNDRSK